MPLQTHTTTGAFEVTPIAGQHIGIPVGSSLGPCPAAGCDCFVFMQDDGAGVCPSGHRHKIGIIVSMEAVS